MRTDGGYEEALHTAEDDESKIASHGKDEYEGSST